MLSLDSYNWCVFWQKMICVLGKLFHITVHNTKEIIWCQGHCDFTVWAFMCFSNRFIRNPVICFIEKDGSISQKTHQAFVKLYIMVVGEKESI